MFLLPWGIIWDAALFGQRTSRRIDHNPPLSCSGMRCPSACWGNACDMFFFTCSCPATTSTMPAWKQWGFFARYLVQAVGMLYRCPMAFCCKNRHAHHTGQVALRGRGKQSTAQEDGHQKRLLNHVSEKGHCSCLHHLGADSICHGHEPGRACTPEPCQHNLLPSLWHPPK